MTTTQPEAWKHHFVPRSLLRYFCPEGGCEYLHVFNKLTGKSFRASLMNAGSENGFNTYKDGDETINFETDFDSVDALLATRLREIHQVRSVADLSPEQRGDWSDLVATQLIRVPITRSTIIAIAEDLDREVRDKFGVPLGEIPSENDARTLTRGLFIQRDKIKASLTAKDMILLAPPEGRFFRISDRPVTMYSTLPYGDVGFDALGVAVFMPLGQRLMLGMLCPSALLKLKNVSLEKLSLPNQVVARLMALREGLTTGAIVQLDEEEFERHNLHQILNCSRFVYGPINAFEDVYNAIEAFPDARSMHSSVYIGEMGAPPPRRTTMPPGSWIVLFGRTDGHMLKVTDAKDSYPLEMTVQSRAALSGAMEDGPFDEMRYFIDGQQVRGMKHVELVVLSQTQQPRVQIRHSNSAIDSFLTTITNRK